MVHITLTLTLNPQWPDNADYNTGKRSKLMQCNKTVIQDCYYLKSVIIYIKRLLRAAHLAFWRQLVYCSSQPHLVRSLYLHKLVICYKTSYAIKRVFFQNFANFTRTSKQFATLVKKNFLQ